MKDFSALRQQIREHALYQEIRTVEDLRIFMETHVFAVWDFMSLLKSLQRSLTCVSVPWVPSRYATSRRLMNEIVLGEESDEYRGGFLSHFELYLAAMEECGAKTEPVLRLLEAMACGIRLAEALESPVIPAAAREFVLSTFETIQPEKPHITAAAFTIGREDLIPSMFHEMVRELQAGFPGLDTFEYYLQRHIEVDSDSHGPMARRMLEELCGGDMIRQQEADTAGEQALRARLSMWDGILGQILTAREQAEPRELALA